MTIIHIPPGKFIDPYLKAHRDPGTRFILDEGVYDTRGCFDFVGFDLCMIAPGCSIVGAGSDRTTIRAWKDTLRTTHEGKPTGYSEILTGGARSTDYSESIGVHGLTIQADSFFPCIGLHLWTSAAKVTDVHVVNIMGARNPDRNIQREGFGIHINNADYKNLKSPGRYDGGHFVFNCQVHLAPTSGAENYSTAVFVGCVERDTPLVRSVVNNCVVTGNNAHAAFAFNDRTTLNDCEVAAGVSGIRRAIFVDTGPVRYSHVYRMSASNVSWALDLRGPEERKCISINDSEFNFRKFGEWSQGILIDDVDSQSTTVGLRVNNCTFMADPSGGNSMARLRGQKTDMFEDVGNRWIGQWKRPELQAS